MEPHTEADGEKSIDVTRVQANIAVGLLADATKLNDPEYFREDDVAEAIGHLEKARDAAPEGSTAGEAVGAALACLEAIEDVDGTERRRQNVHNALAALAPVAAGISERERLFAEDYPRSERDKPDSPVFYNIRPEVADRAIAQVRAGRQGSEEPITSPEVLDYIYQEVHEVPVVYVDGDPLGEYLGRVGIGE